MKKLFFILTTLTILSTTCFGITLDDFLGKSYSYNKMTITFDNDFTDNMLKGYLNDWRLEDIILSDSGLRIKGYQDEDRIALAFALNIVDEGESLCSPDGRCFTKQ